MPFTDEIRRALLNRVGKGRTFANRKKMADELDVDPSQLNRFLSGERGLNATSLGKILDGLGARVHFPDDPADASRRVSFVSAGESPPAQTASPRPEDYLAVPLCGMPEAVTLGMVSEDMVEGWLLVWRHHAPIQDRTNLIALRMGQGDHAMEPALSPGDIVLVDRDDHTPENGRMMLVRGPGRDDSPVVRRVSTRPVDNDMELVFYADNTRQHPPVAYHLEKDYGGNLQHALCGAVIWSWCDVRGK